MSVCDPEQDEDAPTVVRVAMNPSAESRASPLAQSSPTTLIGEPDTKSATGETSLVEPTTTTTTSSTVKLCGVCAQKESRYKCSRCYLPYCSIACSTIHKATHPALEPAQPPKPPVDEVKPHGIPRPGTVASAGFKGPFAALDDSPELRTLFQMFPRLPSQLEQIDRATLRPVNDGGGNFPSGYGRGAKDESWNQDRGLQKGVDALRQARGAFGKDGEGVREFGKLILQIVSRDNTVDATEVIQKELAEENARIIQRLLDGEM